MMPQATCLISFDCEGKWGIADWVSASQHEYFRHDRLTRVYEQLVQLLGRYELKATFAFVGAFTLSPEAYREQKDRFFPDRDNSAANHWIAAFKREMTQGIADGWLNADAFNVVAACPEHEIAAHGFTHTPLHESWVSEAQFRHEMECLKSLPAFQGERLTIVYPRNLVGYADLLPQYGFMAYREALKPDRTTLKGRIVNLLDEINIFRTSQEHAEEGKLVKVPAGFVLNWRFGVRKKIPVRITLRRWDHLLRHAIRKKRVFHLWAHPHNFSSGEQMFNQFERIIEKLAEASKSGAIITMTQQEYARQYLMAESRPF